MSVPDTRSAGLAPLLVVAVLAGCDGKDREPTGTPAEGKRGGTLIALWAGDVDRIDPGITYSQLGSQIVHATQKTLYRPKVDDASDTEPDLAATDPQISADGCVVTVTLKRGVRFSPPVSREVTSADVNDHTIVFDLERGPGSSVCAGGILVAALIMPLSAPVPQEWAKQFDAKPASTYGAHQVTTGPYMIENDRSGNAVGYDPGRRIRLVRNPNWNARLDTRPAYVDEIEIREGNDDATLMSQRILEGENMINGDQPPPPTVLRSALTERKDQVHFVPSSGARWIAMNITIPPFDNPDARRAVIAGFDREAMRLTYGGEVSGDIPTHFLPPGLPGFDEAGGVEGPGLDFMAQPSGDLELAAEYFRRAGFASGRYEGDETFLMVGENEGVGADAALVAREQFERLGFDVRLRRVSLNAMFGKFCTVPSAGVAICPNVGWLKDFTDPQTFPRPDLQRRPHPAGRQQ